MLQPTGVGFQNLDRKRERKGSVMDGQVDKSARARTSQGTIGKFSFLVSLTSAVSAVCFIPASDENLMDRLPDGSAIHQVPLC